MEDYKTDLLSTIDLETEDVVRQQLTNAAKCTKFISVIMFIVAGIIFLFGIIGSTALSGIFSSFAPQSELLDRFSGPLLMILTILVAVVLAVVYYFLYNFSAKIKTAIQTESKEYFNIAIKSLKIFFIITTAFSILSLLNNIFNSPK